MTQNNKKSKVVKINEVDTALLFSVRDFLLGDKNVGDYFVIDEDGVPFGRYISREEAEDHAASLNHTSTCEDNPYSNLSVDELLEECEDFLNNLNKKHNLSLVEDEETE